MYIVESRLYLVKPFKIIIRRGEETKDTLKFGGIDASREYCCCCKVYHHFDSGRNMFEDKDTSFFRPWDNRDASKTTEENRIEGQEDSIKKDRSPTNAKQEDRVDSIPASSPSSERRRRRKSDSSVRTTSSSSSKAEDESRISESLESSKDSDYPLPSAAVSNPAESPSRLNGRSLLDAPHRSIDYLQGTNEPDSLRSDGPWLDPVMVPSLLPTASTTATTGHPFYYRGFPSVLHTFPQELQAPFVEHAVGMLQRQEAVAKQMRKLRPKKFRCEHCDVAFSNNGQLKGHIRIHTGKHSFYFCFPFRIRYEWNDDRFVIRIFVEICDEFNESNKF